MQTLPPKTNKCQLMQGKLNIAHYLRGLGTAIMTIINLQ